MLNNPMNLINMLSASEAAQAILNVLTSKIAIIAYVGIIAVIMIILVISVILNDNKVPTRIQERTIGSANIFVDGDKMPASQVIDLGNGGGYSRKSVEPEENNGKRFCMLSQIDDNRASYMRAKYDENITLKKFCDTFRNYAANRLGLYYEIDDIRRFVAGLSVSHILILQGMSGTGKTSLAHAFGDFLDNTSTVIPVQPMWKERTDLIGYYNEFTKKFNETTLLEKMYEAGYSKDIYITVLDEMNIARIEYYFAEFLSLLELPNPDERFLDVVSDKWKTDPEQLKDGRIHLPNNMWFIGTANNDDSTFAISDKVYDRAMILNLDYKSEQFLAPKTRRVHVSADQFVKLTQDALKEYEITKRNMKRLEKLDEYLINNFHITFGNRIMKQIKQYIPTYVACGGDELKALDDILAKKVIRKLETQNPIYLRSAAEKLCNYLDELFGNDKMAICKEYIHRLERNG